MSGEIGFRSYPKSDVTPNISQYGTDIPLTLLLWLGLHLDEMQTARE
jgi:hypothetical protein